MRLKDVLELQKKWGDKPCRHEKVEECHATCRTLQRT